MSTQPLEPPTSANGAPGPEALDAMFVAPHPDDLEIMAGGTIARLVGLGYRVMMVDLTDGEPTPRGTPEIRRAETEAARLALGGPPRVNLGLPNRVLMDCPEHRFVLATCFRRYRPKVVFGLHGRTVAASPDHYQSQLLTEAARFCSQLTKWDSRFEGTEPYQVPHLVYMPVGLDAEMPHFHSTFIVDITGTMEQKLASVKCYQSQFDAARYARMEHFIRSRAGTVGAACGLMYAEAFALPRALPVSDPISLLTGGLPPSMAPAGPG